MLAWIVSILLSLIAEVGTAATMQDIVACRTVEEPDQQIVACTRVIEDKSSPENERIMATYYRATAHASKGAYEQALADYTEMLKSRPIPLVYAHRGVVYQWLNQYQRSLEDLNEAIRLDPNQASAYKWRGVTLVTLNEFVRAISDFNTAQRLDPKDNEIYWQRARTYEVMRDYKSAIDDYNMFLGNEPKSVKGYISRARMFIELGDLDHALADANEAMLIDPSNPWALSVRGNIYRAKREFKRALDDYASAIQINGYSEFYHERGVAYRMIGDKENAILDFKMAVKLSPTMNQASKDELKALGVDMSDYDPMKLPKAKDLLKRLQ